MYNVDIDALEGLDRPLIAIGTDYPSGFQLPSHRHRRSQLLYGASGVMQVVTQGGSWIVPPQHAVWIPAGQLHSVCFNGVSTRSLYIEPDKVADLFDSQCCRIVFITPFVRQLLQEAVELPAHYDLCGRDGALVNLLLHELALMAPLPFAIPLPADARLLACCRQFLARPDIHDPPERWAQQLFVSISTFRRLFRAQTGMAFLQWRQRACVVLALARLAQGEAVTAIALDMGYESSAAFTTLFRRVLGRVPSDYLLRP